MTQENNQMCGLPPTIEELEQDYAMPALVQLFNDKAQDVDIATVHGLTIKPLGLENADCSIRFSYLPEYRHPAREGGKSSKEGFSLSLRCAESGERITEAIHCLDEEMVGRFNHSGGGTSYEGFENMQFVIDNPPQEIIKSILCCTLIK